jgi:hypothetical protein
MRFYSCWSLWDPSHPEARCTKSVELNRPILIAAVFAALEYAKMRTS